MDTWGSLRCIEGVCEIKTIHNDKETTSAIFTVGFSPGDAQAGVDKTTGTLA